MISQIADFQIEKALSVIKTQIRKIENEMTHENNKIHDKIAREILVTKELAQTNLKFVEKEIKEMIRDNAKQRARDKADNDIRHQKNEDRIGLIDKKLNEHHDSFSALAVVTSMLIENINMQMEAEMADLIDRRMMSLFGVQPTKVDKIAVQNTTKELKKSLHPGISRSPDPQKPETSLEVDVGLPSIDIKRGSIGITNILQDNIDGSELKGGSQNYNLTGRQELREIADEYLLAEQKLQETGKLPITIENQCLLSMQNNRDTSIVLRLFKTACLSYAPSEITYRDKTMTRHYIIGLRRMLIDKVTHYMTDSGLF